MKTVLINISLFLLLLGCAQTGQKFPENYNRGNQQANSDGIHQSLLEKAKALRETDLQLFGGANGVLVLDVLPDGQGEKAGIKPGDILLSYNNTPLNSYEQLIELTGNHSENETAMLAYLRNREKHNLILRGGRIGIQIASIIASQEESIKKQLQLLNEKGTNALNQSRIKEALQLYQQGDMV